MLGKVILFSGSSAVGKTAVLHWLLPLLQANHCAPSLCKIDCVDQVADRQMTGMTIPYVLGVSGDICPDHFLVSNLPELFAWSESHEADTLVIETAGLCHRCSPASEHMIAGCVIDCTASTKAPESLGPMLMHADFIVVTKIDRVSQAEREIILWKLQSLNPLAKVFPVDALAGYGVEPLCDYLVSAPSRDDFQGDELRHTMPTGVCSYCVGERRIGSDYQQGSVGKIEFAGENHA